MHGSLNPKYLVILGKSQDDVNPLKGKAHWLSPGQPEGQDKHSSSCIPLPWWRSIGRGGEANDRTWLISPPACVWPRLGESGPLLCPEPGPTLVEWVKHQQIVLLSAECSLCAKP